MKNKRANIKVISILFLNAIMLILASVSFVSVQKKANLPFKIEKKNLDSNDKNSPMVTKIRDEIKEYSNYKDWVILSYDSIKINQFEEIEFLCDMKNIGDEVDLRIIKDGKEQVLKVKLKPFYNEFYMFTLIIVFVSFLFPAIYVPIRKRGNALSIIFNLMMSSAGFFIVLTWGKFFYINWIDVLLRAFFDISQLSLGLFLLHFTFIFPENKWRNRKRLLIPLYTYILALAAWLTFLTIGYVGEKSIQSIEMYNFFHLNLLEYSFDIIVVFGLLNIVHSFFSNKDPIKRKQLKWILYGATLGPIIYIFVWQIPKSLNGVPWIHESLMILLMLITPFSFFIAVVKHRIMDVDVVISKSMIYSLYLIVFTCFFYLFDYYLAPLFPTDQLMLKNLLMIIGFLIIVMIFDRYKIKLVNLIDRKFFKIKYNFRSVQKEYLETLKECISINQISWLILNSVGRIIPIEKRAFAFYDENIEKTLIAEEINFPDYEFDLEEITKNGFKLLKNQIIANPRSLEAGVYYDRLPDGFNYIMKSSLILVSYLPEYKIGAMLFLGQKKTLFEYSIEDIEILKIKLLNAAITIHRINLQNELSLQMEESKKLTELNRLKSYFISSVSHDLKTPLTSIKLFAEIMKVKQISREKSLEYYDLIESECDRLDRLINNVLDFSKMESGTKQYSFEVTDLDEIIRRVRILFESQARYKKFNLMFDLPEELSPLMIDKDAVTDAIINLISNAIKYSLADSQILLKITEEENMISISVSDNGLGVKQEDIDRIFEPFFRSANEKQLHSGGTGLGLSIVKNIMDAHRGRVTVSSIPGKGSCFTLIFPKE